MPHDTASRESDETYLLGPGETENAKVRDGTLDIKRLRQTNAEGLELWEPVIELGFPLSRSDLAAASAACTLPFQDLRRGSYTIGQFIDEVVTLRRCLAAVQVHKSRRAFSFSDCIAELAQLTVRSLVLDSLSFEHENPERVLAALRALGLDGHNNTNYPRGLKRALGLERQSA
ncbi:MAG: hypothetical protein ACLQUZ_13815 [Rhizomicrobium sp.]